MLTDAPPRKKNLRSFLESGRLKALVLPTDDRLPRIAGAIKSAMKRGKASEVLRVSEEFLALASNFYQVRRSTISPGKGFPPHSQLRCLIRATDKKCLRFSQYVSMSYRDLLVRRYARLHRFHAYLQSKLNTCRRMSLRMNYPTYLERLTHR